MRVALTFYNSHQLSVLLHDPHLNDRDGPSDGPCRLLVLGLEIEMVPAVRRSGVFFSECLCIISLSPGQRTLCACAHKLSNLRQTQGLVNDSKAKTVNQACVNATSHKQRHPRNCEATDRDFHRPSQARRTTICVIEAEVCTILV